MIRLATLLLALTLALPALAQDRHALVIGIDTYAHVPSLQKARNDARDVVTALDAADFRTELVIDPDENTLLAALTRFAGQLDPGDEAVFYFAGHGVEIDGRNYLLPADVPDVPPGQELIVTRRALPVDEVIDAFQRRGARLSLLILDACRDNPFEQVAGRSVGRTRGLGQSEPPEGTFIMYSAGAGQSALDALSRDDPERNSVFTRALLPRMSEPGLDLRVMVQQLRSEVRQLARTVGHNQFPAVYDQLDVELQFIPAAVTPEPAPEPGPAADPCAAAATVWASVEAADSIAALESFQQLYGKTCPVFAALAEDRLAALRAVVEAEPQETEAVKAGADWTRATSVALRGHTFLVMTAAFSPDGQRIVTASRDHTARIWDAETGREIATLSGHDLPVNTAVFSPEGSLVVTTSQDRSARLWDAATGRELTKLSGHRFIVRGAAFAPDGKQIVTWSTDRTTRVWDAATGRAITTLSGHTGAVYGAAFSPDGGRIVTASRDQTARIWSAP